MSRVIYPCSVGLKKLKDGNAKHAGCYKAKGKLKLNEIGIAESKQRPYAAILSCADSRVIPERIFGANEGDLFVVRVAGNIANTSSIASLEYAVEYLKVRVIVVLGHESCGAVEAAINQAKDRLNFKTNLNQLLAHIVPAINGKKPTNDLKKAIINNANVSVEELLAQSEILRSYFDKRELGIFSGYYHLKGKNPGKVDGIDSWTCPKSDAKKEKVK